MLVAYLFLIVWGLVGVLFSRTIHRDNWFGTPRHIPDGRHSVVILRVIGAVTLLAGMLGLRLWLAKERG